MVLLEMNYNKAYTLLIADRAFESDPITPLRILFDIQGLDLGDLMLNGTSLTGHPSLTMDCHFSPF
jgi:hypothetical protein